MQATQSLREQWPDGCNLSWRWEGISTHGPRIEWPGHESRLDEILLEARVHFLQRLGIARVALIFRDRQRIGSCRSAAEAVQAGAFAAGLIVGAFPGHADERICFAIG